jgi:hypothetical protein
VPQTAPGKYVVMATWDDAPHLTEQQKRELWDSIPPYQRDARSKGIPQLGAGAVYPIPEVDIKVSPFKIPPWWPRVYGMDVGWNSTAVLWAAYDNENDIVYFYDEYLRGHAEPAVHVAAIKMRGTWIPGVIDPAANTPNVKDGVKLLTEYLDLDLDLTAASRAGERSPREAGITAVWKRLTTGRLRVFSTLSNFWGEFRIYRRKEDGTVVKAHDHLMDCMRYVVMSGLYLAIPMPDDDDEKGPTQSDFGKGRSTIGGY